MPKDQRTCTKEFKLEAVQLVKSSHKPLAQIARDLGIADSTLHHWCELFTEQGEQAFPFMAEHCQQYPITVLCRTLEVSQSGYYAWKSREPSQHCREDAHLSADIQQLFLDHRQVYGSPRLHALLKARGTACSRKRVVRLMQQLGLSAQVKKRRKPTTPSNPAARFAPHRLNREFAASLPNQKWSPIPKRSTRRKAGSLSR